MEKVKKENHFFTKDNLKRFGLITLGIILMAFAYSFFVDPHKKLIIGGVSGLGTLLSQLPLLSMLDITFSGVKFGSSEIIILALNAFLLIFAWIFVGKKFFLNSLYVSLAYPVFSIIFSFIYEKFFHDFFIDMEMIENFVKGIVELDQFKSFVETNNLNISKDLLVNVFQIGPFLLLVIFGSVISSIGIGLALKNGSSTGGVDILQKIFLDKFKIPFSISLFMIDGSIVLISTLYLKSFFVLLYGVIFILISGVIIDMIVFNGFNSRAINIVTTKPEDIKEAVIKRFDRTVTEVDAIGAYSKKGKKLLIVVMANSEYFQLKSLIDEIDPKAFIYTTRANEVHGEGFSYGNSPKANRKWKKN